MTRITRGRVAIVVALAALTVFSGTAASAPQRQQADTITLAGLPISNGLPLDLGIAKGFFSKQNIEIKKTTLQSGNDIVLAMANKSFDVGYIGYVPAMIARTSGIPLQVIVASDVEGTSDADNWQNILVKGSSTIRTPADLVGKTVAVNALKGVGEVVIKAALKKLNLDPNSVKLTPLPFPTMRNALNNGQVDAIWTPEPFLSQALNLDGARIVMAPGPVLGNYFPNGCYAVRSDGLAQNKDLARRFTLALNESLEYARAHPDEIRAMLPAGTQNVRLPVWSPLVDRPQLLQLAKYAKEFGVITTLPNMTQFAPSSIRSGTATGLIEVTVAAGKITLKQAGQVAKRLDPGKYLIVIKDRSKALNFHITGPGLNKATGVAKVGTVRWTVTLSAGRYVYKTDAGRARGGSFRVS